MKIEVDKGFVEVRELNVYELSDLAELYANFVEGQEENSLRAISQLLKEIVPFVKDKVEKIEIEGVKSYENLCKMPGSHQIFIKIMNELMGGASLGKSSDGS